MLNLFILHSSLVNICWVVLPATGILLGKLFKTVPVVSVYKTYHGLCGGGVQIYGLLCRVNKHIIFQHRGGHLRWSPFLKTSSRSSQQDARCGLVSVTVSPSDCRLRTHTARGGGAETSSVGSWLQMSWWFNLILYIMNYLGDHRQRARQHRHKRGIVEEKYSIF